MIVCQGELPVTFEAADPKVPVGAYPVGASIHVGLILIEEAAKLDVAVMHEAYFSNEEVATQSTVVDQRSGFLSSESDFQGRKCSTVVCHCNIEPRQKGALVWKCS